MTKSALTLVRPFQLFKTAEQEALRKKAIAGIKQLPVLFGFALGAVFIILHWAVLNTFLIGKSLVKIFS